MFRALSHVVNSLISTNCTYEESWIICLTDGQSWDSNIVLKQELQASPTNMHIGLIGVNLESEINCAMEDLCRKYQPESKHNKGFFLPTSANMMAIEQAFGQVAARIPVSQTFELVEGIMSDQECLEMLEKYRPEFIHPSNKLLFSFWVHYLYRRCSVFDQNDDFNYNENQEKLGSSLMEVMLSESSQSLRREQRCRWASSSHTQLIYDFSEQGNPQFRLICTSPDDLDPNQKERLSQLDLPGFCIPTPEQLRSRQTLDLYLSQSLGIPLHEDPDGIKRLKCIDDNRFVLTLDFCLKLLNIHERVSCGVPCIMEGETGVSKTALTKMYSILINSQQSHGASTSTQRDFEEILHQLSKKFPAVSLGDSQCSAVQDQIRMFLKPTPRHNAEEASVTIYDLVKQAHSNRNALFASIPLNLDDVSELLSWFGKSCLEPTFFDINIHGSLSADTLKQKMDEVRRVARKLMAIDVKVIVFLDEINTSCTLGLLKEIIVDHSFNGDMLEDNIVVIAACNPNRKSLSQTKSREIDLGRSWASGHYQVKKLPESLSLMTWDYGSLNTEQEKEFIYHRILMMDSRVSDWMALSMTEVISCSHESIRTLAREHLEERFEAQTTNDAILRAKSVVSLRDIQRVFHLINFFLHDYTLGSNGEFRKAMLIAVGMVYYLRLDSRARAKFVRQLESLPTEKSQHDRMLEVLDSAMNLLIETTEVPEGVALTRGLRENVFMTTVCTLSRTPLMIIGRKSICTSMFVTVLSVFVTQHFRSCLVKLAPGCSKTLAVNVVTDNANGDESPSCFYRKYARIHPFHYQCSKTSTSNEVGSVFDRAIQRQSHVDRSKQQCLVFMDEAGLPEEEKESLKVRYINF